ncbi:MAG: hypothetical protein JNK23_10515 [Opitutaceae bacterium]|nr:hypothetical protein [Opitutaceae bacterium]
MQSWADYERALLATAQALHAEWRTLLPPVDSQPSPTTERACDEWCRLLARDPSAPLLPPDEVRPWLLARLLAAQALAGSLAAQGRPLPEMPPPQIVAQLLIEEWHGFGRKLWPRVQSPFFGRS